MRPILYVCAPYRMATESDKILRLEVIARAIGLGWCPVFAPFLFERVFPEETDAQRELAFDCNRSLLKASAAMLVVGDKRTDGMVIERCDWLGLRKNASFVFFWPNLLPANHFSSLSSIG